ACGRELSVVACELGRVDASVFFFFSSRRRHTRWPRDWSSDVCSSDLSLHAVLSVTYMACSDRICLAPVIDKRIAVRIPALAASRSEERRVGKECRSRGGPER